MVRKCILPLFGVNEKYYSTQFLIILKPFSKLFKKSIIDTLLKKREKCVTKNNSPLQKIEVFCRIITFNRQFRHHTAVTKKIVIAFGIVPYVSTDISFKHNSSYICLKLRFSVSAFYSTKSVFRVFSFLSKKSHIF